MTASDLSDREPVAKPRAPTRVYAILVVAEDGTISVIASYNGRNASVAAWQRCSEIEPPYRAKFVVQGYLFFPE